MNVRAQAVGMASQTQNIAQAIVGQFFPTFLKNCGFYAFYMFAGINVLLAIFVYFIVPETRKVKLEEMDEIFGAVNHVQGGAELEKNHSLSYGSVDHGYSGEEKQIASHTEERRL